MMGGYFRRLTGTVDIQYGRRAPEGHKGMRVIPKLTVTFTGTH